METRANYIAVGMMTLAALALAFIIVFWIGRYGSGENMTPMNVRVQGSVSGLGVGSPVQFNGINVGKVTGLGLDSGDPRFVIVHTSVRSDVPIRSDTRASIGIRGLSGGAFIQLEGGSPNAPGLFSEPTPAGGNPPVIAGDPSSVNEIMNRVNSIAARTERVMDGFETLIQQNSAGVTTTIKNAETFSKALADNSDGVERLLASAESMAKSIETLSEKLDGTLKRTEEIVSAIDPDKVRQSVDDISETVKSARSAVDVIAKNSENIDRVIVNAEKFSKALGDNSEGVDRLLSSAESMAKTVEDLSVKLDGTLKRAEEIANSIDPEKVRKTVDDVSQTVENAKSVTKVFADNSESINRLITNADQLAQSLKGLPEQLNSAVKRVDEIVAQIDPAKIGKTVDDVSVAASSVRGAVAGLEPDAVRRLVSELGTASNKIGTLVEAIDAERVNTAMDQIAGAAKGAQDVVSDVSKVTSKIGNRADDIDQMVSDAAELASRLNNSSQKLDGVITKIDNLLGSGDGGALMADARATLAEFRQTARNLNSRIAGVAAGINKFTGRGLRDTQNLITDVRQSIRNIDRVIKNLERNPSSLITGAGGSRIRETGRSRPRR